MNIVTELVVLLAKEEWNSIEKFFEKYELSLENLIKYG